MKTILLMSALTVVTWLMVSSDVLSGARAVARNLPSASGWRTRASSLGILVAVCCSTVCSATAAAAVIPGDPLQIFMDGSGRLQARFQGYSAAELRPAHLDLADARSGMAFTIYRASGSVVVWCGASGFAPGPAPGSEPTVTGVGTVTNPYRMTTSYVCDEAVDPLNVTQTFIYVNGESEFLARYTVTNPAAQPVRFSAICRGVFTAAGSGHGQGFFDGTSPRILGIFNDAQGSDGGLAEAASTPWARYMEGALPTDSPYEAGESPFFGALDNTVDPTLVTDPRVAVEFDRYASSGLGAGATDTLDVKWFFGHYDGLSLSPLSGSLPVGQTRSVVANSLNHGQPVSGGTIRYAITGANPSSGDVRTAANGTATIAWIGSQPGQDTLTAYIDSDNNGVFDPAIDTQQIATFSWVAAAAPPPPAPPPAPPARPSNRFSVIAARASAGGVIRLTLSARAAGRYRAVARGGWSSKRTFAYGKGSATAKRAGRIKLAIRPTKAAKRRLKTAGIRVRVTVTFTPKGGSARTRRLTVNVKSKRRR